LLGKALLLLNEDGFKQRSLRSGDILYKALQQHHSLIKSLACQSKISSNKYEQKKKILLAFSYPLWNSFPLSSPSFIRHFNFPLSSIYMHPAFNYKLTNFPDPEASIRTRQISNSSSTSSL